MAEKKRDIHDIPAERIPRHIAIIMDGNGRWAKKRGMPRLFGHRAGVENLRAVIKACVEFGVKYLTIYAFSTENWGRPQDEVYGLEKLFHEAFTNEFLELRKQGVRIVHLGQREGIPQDLLDEIDEAVELTVTDRAAAEADYVEAQNILADQAYYLNLYDQVHTYIVSNDIEGVAENPAYSYTIDYYQVTRK